MLSIQQVKKILNKPEMSDEEVEALRDAYRSLAEVIFEQWMRDRQREKLKRNENMQLDNQTES
jgi:hypothetical protein